MLDSVVNGCYPLIRNTELLRSLVPDAAYFNDFNDLVSTINYFLDLPYMWDALRDFRDFNVASYKTNVETRITELIHSKLNSKIPAKYDLVKQSIQNGECLYKKDWVNKFWSFHANGNFQKIRWRLMSEGIFDDITETETKYFEKK